ncbi:hypothetical protein [Streptomyces sp. NBC_00564]|uniref:hypothetical protein n=1 Tax=unclassified Streptomyces TaxID=2593676 RepID=UPI002FCD6D2D|nr:hypothetical protein OG256_46110 [Streptomyces sp. NBC_00564]
MATATEYDNWPVVSLELAKRVPLNGGAGDGPLLTTPTPLLTVADSLDMAPADVGVPGVTVRAFWWGFHVQIDHDTLRQILDAADTVNELVVAVGGTIPSPAQPWIRLIGLFVAGMHEALRVLDRGRGIYISMSWFAPGVFVPTPV